MKYGKIDGVDKPISRLVQGCTMIGRGDDDADMALLDAVHEAGCTAFDTAAVYGGGNSERALGRWVNARRLHEKVVLITKGAHHSGDRKRVTPFDISSDLHDSLARMGIDCVDVYLLHRDDPDYPIEPIVDRLNELKAEGKISAFGGSNWTHQRIAEANAYAAASGQTGFATSSPNLTMAIQKEVPWGDCISISGPEGAEARAWYAESQLPLLCWSSLAGGFFSGRFTRENLESFETYDDQLVVRCYCTEENFALLDRAQQVAEANGLHVAQVALAWVFAQGLNAFALTACRSGDEYAANIASLELVLPDELLT